VAPLSTFGIDIMHGQRISPKEPVTARLKKWPPKREGFAYFRILCNHTFPSGHLCPAELGHVHMITRRKDADPTDPASYRSNHIIPRVPGGGGIERFGLGAFAPELALVAPEKAHTHDMDGGEDEGLWFVSYELGYRWRRELAQVKDLPHFEIFKPRKFGRTGANAARRPMTGARAAALEARIDPFGHYGFSAEYGVLGDVPTLPAVILCPQCATWNRVRTPNDDDLRPPAKA
jgi:hypothetical protein